MAVSLHKSSAASATASANDDSHHQPHDDHLNMLVLVDANSNPLNDLETVFRRRLFRASQILVCLRVSSDEIADSVDPDPFYALVSRYSYWPSLYDDVYAHFKSCLAPRFGLAASLQPLSEIWLELEGTADEEEQLMGQGAQNGQGQGQGAQAHIRTGGQNTNTLLPFGTTQQSIGNPSSSRGSARPVDTRLPIGVSWDIHYWSTPSTASSSTSRQHRSTSTPSDIAVNNNKVHNVIVHFRAPSEVAGGSEAVQDSFTDLAYDRDSHRDSYLNALRKAVYLQYGHANAFMRVPMGAQKQLLEAVHGPTCDHELYLRIITSQLGFPKTWKAWKSVALKVHLLHGSPRRDHDGGGDQHQKEDHIQKAEGRSHGFSTFLCCCEPFYNRSHGTAGGSTDAAKDVNAASPPTRAASATAGQVGDGPTSTTSASPRSAAVASPAAASTDVVNSELEQQEMLRPMSIGDALAEKLPFLRPDSEEGSSSSSSSFVWDFYALGLHLDPGTPLYWLALNCSYLDQYVHIVAVPGFITA
ncbi:unnamed protein product [Amoebophrya sp. A25]|nr:unnamed protein product [Amoebophrya sp. A25]|eukprot:GSA25T00012654001.1